MNTYTEIQNVFYEIKSVSRKISRCHRGGESTCQCRGHEFNPRSEKIAHATEQLSPWATIVKSAL